MDKKPDKYWKDKLDKKAYEVLREGKTEAPFTGELLHETNDGAFECAACGNELFGSDTKFDSGSGWPSFYDVSKSENVELKVDTSFGMVRTEVVCAKCGGHLGHLFDDGPKVMNGKACTGKRYCINSAALKFDKSSK